MMQSIIYAANILGLIMMGALSSSYITITTPLAFTMAAGQHHRTSVDSRWRYS